MRGRSYQLREGFCREWCDDCNSFHSVVKLTTPCRKTGRTYAKHSTMALPGSAAKVDVMERRCERGEGLFHPKDAKARRS